MEYMDGGSLTDRIGDLSIEQALWTGICITHGVYSAHRKGVQHLDLKPSNILFRSVDEGWDIPKVADWGTSRTVTDTDSSHAFTPKYAAPEQHLGQSPNLADRHDLDRSQFRGDAMEIDQYQIGLVLYELLTGEFPYPTASHSLKDSKFKQEPRPPSELVDSLPPAIDGPLIKALDTKPRHRHLDLVILLKELARVYDSIVDRDISLTGIKHDEGWTTVE
jgi:serine/threonine protein kinase